MNARVVGDLVCGVRNIYAWMNSYNRSGSKEKAQIVHENHKKIVELINSEINECDKGDENSNTV